jgi:PAS domain S-box-containing protein
MTFLVTICDFLSVIAGVSAIFLVVLFLVLACTRKSSLAWINVQFSLVVLAIGSECLANVYAGQHSVSAAHLSIRSLVCVAMLACAVLSVPLYRRVRRHPKYDELQAANRELEYTKRLFKTFLDETPFAAYVVDAQDRFVYVNTRAARDHNVMPEQMVQTSYSKWFSPEICAQLVAQNASVRSSGKRQEIVNDLMLPSGKATFLTYKFLLPGPREDSLVGAVSLEISEELKSKAIDSRLAGIVELSPDAIYTVSDERLLTSWNQAAETILGYSASEIIGQPATILAPPGRAPVVAEAISRLAKGEIFKGKDFVHVAKDGTRKHLSLSATKIKSFLGVGSSYAAIARDETESRHAASQMLALNRALNSRIAALSQANKELPLARDQALDALELRSAFVANMSHAIRTPLSGILGVSELMLDKPLDRSTAETVQTVLESAQALLSIVNDILDLSKLQDESVQLESEPFNPSTLVNDCVKLVQPGAASKQLKLTVVIDPGLPERVFGDQSRIRQILVNLLGNAVKFTATGEVSIGLSLLSQDDEVATLQFAVADTGIGIAPEDAALLFTPFSRVEKSTKGIKGSGLGLAISKRFVDLMEGTIEFESRKSGGSRFWFVLSLRKDAGIREQKKIAFSDLQRSAEAELLSSSRVLLVEDNPVISMLTLRVLGKFGVKVESVSTGRGAIEKVRSTAFDIILMDVNLPDISGYEATSRIRQIETERKGRKHVIIAVTAGAMSGDREKALEAGMNDYLAKPVHPAQLREALVRWLGMPEQTRANLPT